ncbi:MAG: hypothetical protein MZW92_41675 [Comamonadaceae bacterium]|nr:hypothetical protein [Comamonadaceae bacterium]
MEIPLGLLTCVTGVSGSGKSTLINDTLYRYAAPRSERRRANRRAPCRAIEGLEQFDKVIDIDQSPDRPHAALQPGHLHRAVHARSASCSPRCPKRARAAISPGRFSFNVQAAGAARPARATA